MRMKNKVLVSFALVMILALSIATSVFAAAANPAVSIDNAAPKAGDTVVFTITTNNFALMGDVAVSDNLEYVSCSDNNSDSAGFIVAAASVTYTYKVKADAQPGSNISFTVSGMTGTDIEAKVEYTYEAISVSGKVAGTTPTPQPDPPASTPDPVKPAPQPDPAPSAPDTSAKSPRTGVYE